MSAGLFSFFSQKHDTDTQTVLDSVALVFSEFPSPALVLDKQKNIIYANADLLKTSGYSKSEMLGQHGAVMGIKPDLLVPGAEFIQDIKSKNGTVITFRVRVSSISKSGFLLLIFGRIYDSEKKTNAIIPYSTSDIFDIFNTTPFIVLVKNFKSGELVFLNNVAKKNFVSKVKDKVKLKNLFSKEIVERLDAAEKQLIATIAPSRSKIFPLCRKRATAERRRLASILTL
ncbi:PAS domain S-box-containing protein [Elusimicrobium posterum]|uniref:PAS domain S-box protein n=1 Tax=Elusimicrobium posterum TaxID=3116653 RepID=UPI003C71136B